MKRGEIWTLRDRQYASKARPVIVIQNDAYDNFDSVILCLFTSYDSSEIEVRVPVTPTPENGLHDLNHPAYSIEQGVQETKATLAMEGMNLTDEETRMLTDYSEGKVTGDELRKMIFSSVGSPQNSSER